MCCLYQLINKMKHLWPLHSGSDTTHSEAFPDVLAQVSLLQSPWDMLLP